LPKAAAAQKRLARINSQVRVRAAVADLSASNVDDLFAGAGLILDGTDNFETRYLINDYSVSRGLPWVYGAAVASYGIAMPVIPGHTACLRCVYPEPPGGAQPTCETAGVLNAIVSAVASLQVADAMQILITGRAPSRITTIDVWQGGIRQLHSPERDPDCPCCSRRDFRFLREAERPPVLLCGRNAVQIRGDRVVDLAALRQRLTALGEVRANEFALRFALAPYEMTVFADGRAIVKGTSDTGVARSFYTRYVG
jgi:adenylyltransferase/sulfurtransferase